MEAGLAAVALGVSAFAAVAGGAGAASHPRVEGAARAEAEAEADRRLDGLIEGALREGGSFFTAEERAVIERKCGYAPGEWDGIGFNMHGNVFHCANGRRVDEDAELRAVMRAASPRIEARVEAVMARADVQAAIAKVAEEATREALASIDHAKIAAEAARDAEAAVREAMEERRREAREERRGRR